MRCHTSVWYLVNMAPQMEQATLLDGMVASAMKRARQVGAPAEAWGALSR